MKRRRVGCFSKKVIEVLELDIEAGTCIYISESNIMHMKASHPGDYAKYGSDIEEIISQPDFVGKNRKDGSIEFIKEYCISGEYVKIAVRVTLQNVFYARSMYTLNPSRVKNFIAKGTLKSLTNEKNSV